MDREFSEDVLDLGEASTETKGPWGMRPDEALGQISAGLADD